MLLLADQIAVVILHASGFWYCARRYQIRGSTLSVPYVTPFG